MGRRFPTLLTMRLLLLAVALLPTARALRLPGDTDGFSFGIPPLSLYRFAPASNPGEIMSTLNEGTFFNGSCRVCAGSTRPSSSGGLTVDDMFAFTTTGLRGDEAPLPRPSFEEDFFRFSERDCVNHSFAAPGPNSQAQVHTRD